MLFYSLCVLHVLNRKLLHVYKAGLAAADSSEPKLDSGSVFF